MKYWILTAAAVFVSALLFGTTAYITARPEPVAGSGGAIDWLQLEFNLDAEQARRIAAIHRAQSARCEEHCQAIQRARRALRVAREQNRSAAELRAAEEHLEQVDRHCREALERHVREVAALMDPAEGERYLGVVLPRIAVFDHTAAPNLDLKPEVSEGHGHRH